MARCKHCGCERDQHANGVCPNYSVFEPEDEVDELRRENARLKTLLSETNKRNMYESPYTHNLLCGE